MPWHEVCYCTPRHAGSTLLFSVLLLLVALLAAGCREQGDITIHKLDFQGVKQVDKKALAAALQTKTGSRLPWGQKTYFDRRAFDADLERIVAFYRDRGFPDARVSSFDIQLNDMQDQVDVILNISEGQPTLVAGIELTGFDVVPPRNCATCVIRCRCGRTAPQSTARPCVARARAEHAP